MLEATQGYLEEQDLFTQWVDAECVTGLLTSDTHAALFRSWTAFALANGEEPGSGKDFAEHLVNAGFQSVKHTPGDNSKRGYRGIAVRQPEPTDWTDPC